MKKIPKTASMRLLALRDLPGRGIHYSTGHIRKMIARGEFPEGVKLSPRKTVWDEAVIDRWIRSKLEAAA